MFCIFCIGLLWGKEIPSPDLEFGDDLVIGDHTPVVYPYDAVIHENAVFVAGGNHAVEIFRNGTWLKTIGREGEGPGEFRHVPTTLAIEGEHLIVTEMYNKRQSVFTLDGSFIASRSPQFTANTVLFGGKIYTFTKIPYPDAVRSGFRVHNSVSDCFLGSLVGISDEEIHRSNYFLEKLNEEQLVYIRRDGLLQIYDSNCHLVRQFTLDLAHFTRQPEKNILANQLIKRLKEKYPERTYRPAYKYGIPIIDSAVYRQQTLVLLVSDEHDLDRNNKPGKCSLILTDLANGAFLTFDLSSAPRSVNVSGDFLILVSNEDGYIRLWNMDRITS